MADGKTKPWVHGSRTTTLVISSGARNLSVGFRLWRSLSSFGMTTPVNLADG